VVVEALVVAAVDGAETMVAEGLAVSEAAAPAEEEPVETIEER
jgi:hypothetical protein